MRITKVSQFEKFVNDSKAITWTEAKTFYDNLGGADPAFTSLDVARLLRRFCDRVGRGRYISRAWNKPLSMPDMIRKGRCCI